MNEDIAIYEVMLELAEEENTDLKVENDILVGYIRYLEHKNKELYKEYNNLLKPDNRLNKKKKLLVVIYIKSNTIWTQKTY